MMEQKIITNLYNQCEELTQKLIVHALKFQSSGIDRVYQELEIKEIKTCSGSDLHRGYYCPSPVFDLLIGNTKRGRILQRPNSRTRFSHKYYFGKDEDLLYVEQPFQTEYLVRDQDYRYGYTFDKYGLCCVAMETFKDNRLSEFLWANISPLHLKKEILQGEVYYEAFAYDNIKLIGCSHHFMLFGNPQVGIHENYQFSYKGKIINGFWYVREDGSFKFKEPTRCPNRDLSLLSRA